MRLRPIRLNAAIASLFVLGSACFVVGSVPAYFNSVGGVTDGITYFVGSIFFTTASFLLLVQAQTPSMTGVDEGRQYIPEPVTIWRWLPHDRNWLASVTQFAGTLFFNVSTLAALAHNASVQQQDRHVWRPDVYGSTLFLVASALGILAVGGVKSWQPRSFPWRIAWLNMSGSLLFMVSALASFVLPSSGSVVSMRADLAGTLFGFAVMSLMSNYPTPLIGYGAASLDQTQQRYGNVARVVYDGISAYVADVREARPVRGIMPNVRG